MARPGIITEETRREAAAREAERATRDVGDVVATYVARTLVRAEIVALPAIGYTLRVLDGQHAGEEIHRVSVEDDAR